MNTQVFAFAQIHDGPARQLVYEEIFRGRSRFGRWDQKVSLNDAHYGKNDFLRRIKQGDWIVHINMPRYGRCVAVQAAGEYFFDEGLSCSWGKDFNNLIPNEPSTVVEFDRRDINVLPSVNLSPLKRGQRVIEVEDFLKSIENLRSKKHDGSSADQRAVIHLRDRVTSLLPQVTEAIQAMNKSKEFENFLHRVFLNLPNVRPVKNGFRWGTDNGADLIVDCDNPIVGNLLRTRLVVQAKSYTGDHYDLKGVDQLVEAIETFTADAGVLITTARSTQELEKYVADQSEKLGKPIAMIAGDDVARFVLKHAPELLVD